MCGITGAVSFANGVNLSNDVRNMNISIAHRGPDAEGYYSDENNVVFFGHRRLSIIDLSELGQQPMSIDDYVITYNGEVYNYLELKFELESFGVKFFSKTDTEVILQAYINWGESCVTRFNGMWAFAIYDKKKNIIFCSRDRFGIKPFYYTFFKNSLYFASEIKAFLKIEAWESNLNLSRAYDFILQSLVSHTNETLIDGIYELRGGNNLIINLDKQDYNVKKYYNLENINNFDNSFSEEEHFLYFENLFKNAVKLTLRSDVKVGSALSGGLDSSTIVLLVNKLLKESGIQQIQECVSAVFNKEDKGIDESEFIDLLASKKDFDVHKVQPNWNHLLCNLDKIIWHQDEPFPTLSIYAQFSVFEEASRKSLKVMLDGQGADEIFAGYESFYEGYFKELLSTNPFRIFTELGGFLTKHKKYSIKKIKDKIFVSSFKNIMLTPNFILNVKPYKRKKKKSIRGMSEDYLEHFGLHSLLKYEDRNSMAFSIESRVPFLDYKVVEYALSLKTRLKIKNGVRKFILRESFKKILPKAIYLRYDKLGFPTPQERWTIENHKIVDEMLKEAIYDLNILFDVDYFAKSKDLLAKGDKNFIFLVWRIIIFSKWRKLYNVKICLK
jgi:asparagine synthase (glutamine-hydrolysing)